MMKRRLFPVTAIILMLGPSGCMGVGMLARAGTKNLFGEKEKPTAERVAVAQETEISAVHGGSAGTPIAWSDAKSGLHGTLVPEAGGAIANGCRSYEQTVILAGETLAGRVVACSQPDGSWKLSREMGSP